MVRDTRRGRSTATELLPCRLTRSSQLAEVKSYFADHKKQYEEQLKRYTENLPQESSPGTAWLFGSTKRIDHEEILAAFPPRQTADLLITRYFNTYDPVLRKFDDLLHVTRTKDTDRFQTSYMARPFKNK